MKKETKGRLVIFFAGIIVATFVSTFITLAFFEANMGYFIRNIVITNLIFIALNFTWIKLHKRYGDMYKSGLELEDKK